jgi:hypothetical protein
MLSLPRELVRESVDEPLNGKVLEFGRNGAGVESADIEKRI